MLVVVSGCLGSSQSAHWGKPDPDTLIVVTGSLGGVKPREPRSQVEHVLGAGKLLSSSTHRQKVGGTYTLTRVEYPTSQLVIWYVQSKARRQSVFAIFTTSPRYHTTSGLHVGSTLAEARAEHGLRCYGQPGYVACQGGLGYEKPLTSFTVKSGRVVRVFVAAFAD